MNDMLFYQNSQRNKGFTLVEIMVALTIFSVLMVSSVGVLLVMIDANAKAQAIYAASTNLSFALDSMTRDMRTGYHYYCVTGSYNLLNSAPTQDETKDCADGSGVGNGNSAKNPVFFTRARDGAQVGYRRNDQTLALEQYVDLPGPSDDATRGWVPITSTASGVTVAAFQVEVKNSGTHRDAGNLVQPIVLITLRGSVANGLETTTDFNIQTQITQRRLDII
jgi:prepilin-type N-terminal cleavage/methylation domain-containing protein